MNSTASTDGMRKLGVRRIFASSFAEMEAVQAIYLSEFPPSERKPSHYITEVASRSDSQLLVIEQDGDVAGFGLVRGLQPANAHLLEYIAIAKPFQSLGLGRILLDRIVASVSGATIVEVEAPSQNPDQLIAARRVNFYLRACFKTVSGFEYRMPKVGDEIPPPMWLMIHDFPSASVTARELRQLVNVIYQKIYGVPAYPAFDAGAKAQYLLVGEGG